MLASPISQYWDQDLSAQAFAAIDDKAPELRPIDGGYELTRRGATPTHPQLISATLVLDRNLQPIRQIMRVRAGGEVRELRFIQADYERRPSASVPDATFDPESDRNVPGSARAANVCRPSPRILAEMSRHNRRSWRLACCINCTHLAPTPVCRSRCFDLQTAACTFRVPCPPTRSVTQIARQLSRLAAHELLDLRIVSSRDLKLTPGGFHGSVPIEAYEVSQPGFAADERIRRYFSAQGLSGDRLDAAVAQFSRDALQHAQRALQHAYALDRLGSSVPPKSSVPWDSRARKSGQGW